MKKYVEITVELEDELYEKVKTQAEKEGMTIEDFIIKVLTEYVEEYGEKKNKNKKQT